MTQSSSTGGQEIDTLITLLSRLPGFGGRSARRAVLAMIQKREHLLEPLTQAITRVNDTVRLCEACYNISTQPLCQICCNDQRKNSVICVVETVTDLWALERTQSFYGHYHVLGGLLSALDGVRPEDLHLDELVKRVKDNGVTEVVLAITGTLDGRATAHYIADMLEDFDVCVTSLAQGVPIGGELDFLDEGTITTALQSRKSLA